VAFALFADFAMRRLSITSVKLSRALMTEADIDAIAEMLSPPDLIAALIRDDEADANGGEHKIHQPGANQE